MKVSFLGLGIAVIFIGAFSRVLATFAVTQCSNLNWKERLESPVSHTYPVHIEFTTDYLSPLLGFRKLPCRLRLVREFSISRFFEWPLK